MHVSYNILLPTSVYPGGVHGAAPLKQLKVTLFLLPEDSNCIILLL